MKPRSYVRIDKLFDSQVIGAGESATSDPVDIKRTDGYFSIQYEIGGNGTLDFKYLLSLDNVNFKVPVSAADISTGVSSGSGIDGDGKDVVSFAPEPARWMKIAAQETGGSNAATLTLRLLTL
jgi:hypothetical protein